MKSILTNQCFSIHARRGILEHYNEPVIHYGYKVWIFQNSYRQRNGKEENVNNDVNLVYCKELKWKGFRIAYANLTCQAICIDFVLTGEELF